MCFQKDHFRDQEVFSGGFFRREVKIFGKFFWLRARARTHFELTHTVFVLTVRMNGMCKDRIDMMPHSSCRTDGTVRCTMCVVSRRFVLRAEVEWCPKQLRNVFLCYRIIVPTAIDQCGGVVRRALPRTRVWDC